MRKYSAVLLPLCSAFFLVGCGSGGGSSQNDSHLSDGTTASRLIFRCTLADSGRSFSVMERNGQVSFDGGPFKTLKVSKFTSPEQKQKTYVFEGANTVDGVPHSIALNIGTDGNSESVTTDGDTFNCKWKATINTAVLDHLVKISTGEGEKALAAVLSKRASIGLCKDAGDNSHGYGFSVLQRPLGGNVWMVQVYCSLGAYQGNYQWVKINMATGKANIVRAQTYNSATKKVQLTSELFGVPTFDNTTGVIGNFAKGRGLGDCGEFSKFRPYSSGDLLLSEVRVKAACDGVFTDPATWPLVYKK